MSKKGLIVGGVTAAVIISIIASFSIYQTDESLNLDMGRTHGSVSTVMGSPILGSSSAPITIIEFGDYQCPNCQGWFMETKPVIIENYIDTGKVNLIFVDLALLGQDSPKASEATYCAEEQGQYWKYHDLLYENQQGIDDGWANSERLKAFAFDLGLDMELFETCLDSGKFQKRVNFNTREAIKNGASATPTFIIVNSEGEQQKIAGRQPYSVFQTVIDSMS